MTSKTLPKKLMDLTSYRWDSILKISELAELCSDGNRVIQKQMLDTLSRFPTEQIHVLTRPIGNSKVLLCEGVHFLNRKGYNLPEWTDSLKSGEGLETSTPSSVDEGNRSQAAKPLPISSTNSNPTPLAKRGAQWTEDEVQAAHNRHKTLKSSGAHNFAQTTAQEMGISITKMNVLFRKFLPKKGSPISKMTNDLTRKG